MLGNAEIGAFGTAEIGMLGTAEIGMLGTAEIGMLGTATNYAQRDTPPDGVWSSIEVPPDVIPIAEQRQMANK